MEPNSMSRRYETRRSTRAKDPVTKSRVDWSRTKRTRVLDTEEEEEEDEIASASEEDIQTSSEDEAEAESESVVNETKEETSANGGSLPALAAGCDGPAEEGAEEESVALGKRKRSRLSVMYDSDSDGSDNSSIVRKVFAKRKCLLDEDDSSAEKEQQASPAEEETKRKQNRLLKLRELSQRRSTQTRSDRNRDEDVEDAALITEESCPSSQNPTEISDSSDGDSMKDFIVEEEESNEWNREESEADGSQPEEKKHAMSSKSLLGHYMSGWTSVDPSVHLKRTVKAFLINAVDDTFLISLYEGERQKKYAKEMLASLRYLDDRFVQPRLDNLLSRCRWKERYKERVDTYPDVRIIFGNPVQRSCEACELQRYCKFMVVLSGKSYNSKTMETDDFMSHDKQRLKVGIVCRNRTQVYHNLKHFKYKLYQECFRFMKNDALPDEPLKDTVDRVFSQLEEDGWIEKRYTALEDYMNDADFFQEEKMD